VAIILPFFAQCQPAAPYVTEQFAVLDISVGKKDLQQGKTAATRFAIHGNTSR
jgi:hypothetical protein